MEEKQLNALYESSINHKEKILKSKICGCFYCKKMFEPKDIKMWLKDRCSTAVCPFCGTDTVIGDACGEQINTAVLEEMNKRYFG